MKSATNVDHSIEPSPAKAGGLPPWEVDDLPDPLPYSFRNLLRTMGPGAILLAGAIGGGEWLVGPAVGVQFGPGLFWIASVAIVLQSIFNLEAIRYTLYTGEPIVTGIMRLKPGSRFWAVVYSSVTAAQLGLPAVVGGCAAVLFAAFMGRMPDESDFDGVTILSYGVIAGVVVILLFGRTIERMLEYVSWVMIVLIFGFLLIVNVCFVPLSAWESTFWGFLNFGYVPNGVDLPLLGALAATAGSGGIANLTVSNWARDKGFGMGAKTGAIAAAVGQHKIHLSPAGKVFPVTSANMHRWKLWWKYAIADQAVLWGGGALVGMFLNVNLAMGMIPAGSDISQIGAGAYQAEYMSRLWDGFWILALLNGFWVLFSTHLGNTDVLVRTITDIIWVSSSRARRWRNGNISVIYYTLLFIFTIWAMMVVNWANAMTLMTIMGNIAGLVLAVASIQILRVNTRLLPKALQPPLWRKLGLALCCVFYTGLFLIVVWDQIQLR